MDSRRKPFLPLLSLFLLLLGVLLAAASGVAAEMPRQVESGAAALAGTWVLEAADDLHPDGSRTPAYGEHPQGILMVDPTGQYSLQIFRSERAKFAAGDKRRGTPDEFQSAVLGMSSHIGHCTLDPAAGIVTFRIDRASFPNWDGTEQQRQYTLEGDRLSYRIPAAATGTALIPISVWRRVR